MDDAPSPLITPNYNIEKNEKIIEILYLDNQKYFMKIIQSTDNQSLIFRVEYNEIEFSDIYYENKFKLNDLYLLNKFFCQCDTIQEVIKALENNKKIISTLKQFYPIN